MKCRACGEEVVQEGVFCHKCGARLDGAAPDEASSDWSPEEPPVPQQPDQPTEQPADTAATGRERFAEAVASRRNSGNDEETDLWEGTYSSRAMIGMWVACAALSAVLLGVAIWISKPWVWMYVAVPGILLVWLYATAKFAYRRLSVRYHLTSKRFFHEKGILRHVTDRIEVIDMDDIAFEQSIIDRLVGVGTIRITSTDRSHPILLVAGIENVKEVATIMDEVRLKERLSRGLHIESI